MGMSNSMACVTCKISEPTYISYKDEILKKIKNEVDNYFSKIVRSGCIQVSEIVIGRDRQYYTQNLYMMNFQRLQCF